jgi:hypothetical protein
MSLKYALAMCLKMGKSTKKGCIVWNAGSIQLYAVLRAGILASLCLVE